MLARPTQAGLGEHVGIQLPTGQVVHMTPAGKEVVPLEAFSAGLPLREVSRADPVNYLQILNRVEVTLQKPDRYRLIDNNCEHYASYLMTGKSESKQIAGLFIAIAAASIFILSK
jgi:hypothetical protein